MLKTAINYYNITQHLKGRGKLKRKYDYKKRKNGIWNYKILKTEKLQIKVFYVIEISQRFQI